MHEDEVLFTEFFNQKLKERGYTLEQLSEETGIAMKHLESFSHGRFERLPSAPYVRGYFVKLGGILGFDPDEWWTRIREEDTVHKAGPQDRMPGNRFGRVRGRAFIWGAVVVLLLGLYVAARYTTILGEPRLSVTAPVDSSSTASIVTFQGTVKNGDLLTVNGQNVPLAADGSWSVDVALQPGPNPNIVTIQARKLLGRTVTLTREIVYNPSTPQIVPLPGAGTTTSGTASSGTTTPGTIVAPSGTTAASSSGI